MALCKFFTLKDPEKAPDKKNCVPSAKLRVLLPAKTGIAYRDEAAPRTQTLCALPAVQKA